MESATLGSGGDGEVELGAIVVDVGRELRWYLVVMGEVYRTGSNCSGYG